MSTLEDRRRVKQEIEATDASGDIDTSKCGQMSVKEQDAHQAQASKTSKEEKDPPWLLLYHGAHAPETIGTAAALMFFSGGLGFTHTFQPLKDECQCPRVENLEAKKGLLDHTETLKLLSVCRLQLSIIVSSEFSALNAVTMARMSHLAYLPPSVALDVVQRIWGVPYAKTLYGPKTNTKVLVMSAENFVIIAFKGTEKNLSDLKTDINIRKFNAPDKRFTVHTGFKRGMSEVYREILTFIESLPKTDQPKKIFVTGHSLGGALATLFVARYLMCDRAKGNPEDFAAVYTFGSPKVGDPKFAQVYDELMKEKTFRIVNHKDVVATIPPLNYKHIGTKILVSHDGNITSNVEAVNEWYREMRVMVMKTHRLYNVQDHYLVNYIYILVKHIALYGPVRRCVEEQKQRHELRHEQHHEQHQQHHEQHQQLHEQHQQHHEHHHKQEKLWV